MRVCIHRGAEQIGGSCVEIEAKGSRIVIDLGLPLDAVDVDAALLPPVRGLLVADPSLLAVVLSHGHRDHWGLLPLIRADLPVILGEATHRILSAAAFFVPGTTAPTNVIFLRDLPNIRASGSQEVVCKSVPCGTRNRASCNPLHAENGNIVWVR
jgi:ribonuclease J